MTADQEEIRAEILRTLARRRHRAAARASRTSNSRSSTTCFCGSRPCADGGDAATTLYAALALTVRDRMFKQGVRTMENYAEQDARVVAYLSAEFLPGPHLANNLLNLGIDGTDPPGAGGTRT